MNRRGYTFIELLGVIVLLGIILVISIPSITGALKGSRVKSEEVFLDKLSDTIDSYITMNSNKFTYTYIKDFNKIDNNDSNTVKIYSTKINGSDITMQNIINDELITASDFKDPAFGDECNKNTIVEVYRDDDYVFCHKIRVDSLDCLSDDYKEKHSEEYAINTCIWEE